MSKPGEYTDLELVNFVGCNIPQEVENVLEEFNPKVLRSFENDDQREAYKLGIKNTMSVLQQVLESYLEDEQVVFYHPEVVVSEEMSIGEIIEWASSTLFSND